ncbi:hypothetical protein [Pikeienuella sp. HZG-20]|uniref:hypothetical protein n=1 Tax=Paludibacillus litoralis TaxID=3133267 RepID=UPI0030EED8AC
MLERLLEKVAAFGNRRGQSLSIPVFDGALKPNNLLEEAEVLVAMPGLEDMAVNREGELFAAAGAALYRIAPGGEAREIAAFDAPVTAFAIQGDGGFAVGLGAALLINAGTTAERRIGAADGAPFVAITAIHAARDGALLVADASDRFAYQDWAHDLMSRNRGGRLLRIAPDGGAATTLASGLAYAFGAFEHANGDILVSESWAHGVAKARDGRAAPAIERLPGYPCRFAPAADGGFWLTLFCSRTQLVEFVLTEHDYRREMMATIDQRHWISPSFGSGRDFLEPLQGGGVKQMGVLKPWAPPRSYGLVVRYAADFTPVYALHSRVGGLNHGAAAAAETGDALLVLSKGAGRIVRLSLAEIEKTLFDGDG